MIYISTYVREQQDHLDPSVMMSTCRTLNCSKFKKNYEMKPMSKGQHIIMVHSCVRWLE